MTEVHAVADDDLAHTDSADQVVAHEVARLNQAELACEVHDNHSVDSRNPQQLEFVLG